VDRGKEDNNSVGTFLKMRGERESEEVMKGKRE
jgi:hypothetical protein